MESRQNKAKFVLLLCQVQTNPAPVQAWARASNAACRKQRLVFVQSGEPGASVKHPRIFSRCAVHATGWPSAQETENHEERPSTTDATQALEMMYFVGPQKENTRVVCSNFFRLALLLVGMRVVLSPVRRCRPKTANCHGVSPLDDLVCTGP